MSVKYWKNNKNGGAWEVFPGTAGVPGKDAYIIAQEHGYEGTANEYNDCLVKFPEIQNQVDEIVEYFEQADSVPTKDSKNMVISGGVYSSIESVKNDVNSTITNLDQRVTDSISEVDTRLNKKINNVNTKLTDSIDSVNTTLTNRIENVKNLALDKVKEATEQFDGKLAEHENDCTKKHNEIKDEISELGRKVTNCEKNIDEFEASVDDKLKKQDQELHDIDQKVSAVDAKVDLVSNALDNSNSRVNELEKNLNATKNDLSSLEHTVELHDTYISSLETSVTNVKNEINNAKTELNTRVDNLKSSLSTKIDNTNTEITNVKNSISTVNNTVQLVSDKVDRTATKVDSLTENVEGALDGIKSLEKQLKEAVQNADESSETLKYLVVDNLTTNDAAKALSARQGMILKEMIDTIQGFDLVVLKPEQELPTFGRPRTLYLKHKDGHDRQSYDEYIYVNDAWELIGSLDNIDLENYYTKDEVYSKAEVYSKNETYSKAEVDNIKSTIVDSIPSVSITDLGSGNVITSVEADDSDENRHKIKVTKNLDVYSKDEVYNKNEVYNKSEVFNKQEVTNNITSAIEDLVVDGDSIGSESVTSEKIGNGAVTSDKLDNGSVTNDKLGNGAVTEEKIGSGAVTEDKLADNSVSEEKIKDGAVTNEKLADNSVTNDKLGDKSVTGDKIADNTITGDNIKNGSIKEEDIDPDVVSKFTTIVDDNLNGTSVNPVQNKVIYNKLQGIEQNTPSPTDSQHWNEAYSWGNHAEAGYLTDSDRYTLPEAKTNTLGGIKVGFTDSGASVAVKLNEDNKAYSDVTKNAVITALGYSPMRALNTVTTPGQPGIYYGTSNVTVSNVYVTQDNPDATIIINNANAKATFSNSAYKKIDGLDDVTGTIKCYCICYINSNLILVNVGSYA